MILNYRLYQETLFKNFFFSRIIEKNAFVIYSNKEYYCRLFRKVCFCICPSSFIQTSINVLIMGNMHMCACANNYCKCVNSKCLRVIMLLFASVYILQSSRRRNLIKKNIYDGVRFYCCC